MSYIYLIRHGQAGTRDHYDQLSELGVAQAALLGKYLASQRVEFQSVYAGELVRQQQTMNAVAQAYETAGVRFPEHEAHEGWNEFDLDHVYRALAPQLAAEDPQFRTDYERMREEVRLNRGVATADVHRRWSPCDIKVVDAWIRGRYPYNGESWSAFLDRVSGRRAMLNGDETGNIAVFTSATPIAIWSGLALEALDERVMRLAAVLYNTSITVLRWKHGDLRMFSFNGVPHLADAAMRTHR